MVFIMVLWYLLLVCCVWSFLNVILYLRLNAMYDAKISPPSYMSVECFKMYCIDTPRVPESGDGGKLVKNSLVIKIFS